MNSQSESSEINPYGRGITRGKRQPIGSELIPDGVCFILREQPKFATVAKTFRAMEKYEEL